MKMQMSPKRRIIMLHGHTFSVPKYIYATADGWQVLVKVKGKAKLNHHVSYAHMERKGKQFQNAAQAALDQAEKFLSTNIVKLDMSDSIKMPKVGRNSKKNRSGGMAHYVQGAVGANWARVYVGTTETITEQRVVLAARQVVSRLRYYLAQRQQGAVVKTIHMPKSLRLVSARDKDVQAVVQQFR